MMEDRITVFAETTFRNKRKKFGIKTDDRRRHMYLIGKTGMGKSTILENMIIEDIRAGNGVAVVDPHGDLAEKVIEYIPSSRINDVIYFNPADTDYPIAFNVVEQVDADVRHLVASGLLGVFKKLWADSWGPRLEYILRNAVLAILDYPGSTLLAVTRILSDKNFRKKVIANIKDPVVKAFWVNEFAGYNDKFASEAVAPIQNKVGQFLSSSLIRNIVGQAKSTINMREIMDNKKILILNLSKGRIGEDNSALLGAMMITKIQLAAMSRVDISEKTRKDFYLYVDEFQNFTSDSFANILSEARKYRLNLILAHQYIEQLSEEVRNAVFGNVGTLVVFRVGATDAEFLVKEFQPTFMAEDILSLPKYEIYLKLMIDGIASEPFSARGLAPFTDAERTNNVEKVINVSREKYAKDKETVMDRINKWHLDEEENLTKEKEEKGQTKNFKKELDPEVYKHQANCDSCGRETKLAFEPDGIRPVFCKECLTLKKEEREKKIKERKILKQEELKKLENKTDFSSQQAKQNIIVPKEKIKVEKKFVINNQYNAISNQVKNENTKQTNNFQAKKIIEKKELEEQKIVEEISLADAFKSNFVSFGKNQNQKKDYNENKNENKTKDNQIKNSQENNSNNKEQEISLDEDEGEVIF